MRLPPAAHANARPIAGRPAGGRAGPRFLGWLCSYVLVLQLVLAGLVTGVMAAPADMGMWLCMPSTAQSDAPAPASHDARIVSCTLCASIGHTPALLPQISESLAPQAFVQTARDRAAPHAPPERPSLAEQARPRAPPYPG